MSHEGSPFQNNPFFQSSSSTQSLASTDPDSVQWLFLDLNSYFASVEQQLNPKLRNKPVAVVPMMTDSTCCIAASYEAKAYGVKTGTKVGDARRMCPGIQFIEGNHEMYSKFHNDIVEVVDSVIPVSAVMSIDEMACELMGREQKLPNAIRIAQEIKKKIRLNVGICLTSSIGLSSNKFLAKVAADMQKPDGLTILLKKDLPGRLLDLKPRDISGIGHSMEKRLQNFGITTMAQLWAADAHFLREVWGGVMGERFWLCLRGEEVSSVQSKTHSISHSHVLPPHLRNSVGAYAVTQKLMHRAAVRMRKMNYWCREIYLGVRYTSQKSWEGKIKIMECQDSLTLIEGLMELWERQKKSPEGRGAAPMKTTVVLGNLVHDDFHNLSFFDTEERRNLSKSMDGLNAKYGKNTVYFAGVDEAKNAAPARIAFQSIPDFDI